MTRLLVLVALLLLGGSAQAAPVPGPVPGFRWPLAGAPVVDRGFAPPATPWGAGHRGVDLRALTGQPVLAAGPGQVSYAGELAGRGVVTVTHAHGLRTTYEPVRPSVRVGQSVPAGAVLGRLATGHASCRAGTTCLHWGLLRGDTYLDPLSLLSPLQVRLLPLGDAALPGGGALPRPQRTRSTAPPAPAVVHPGTGSPSGPVRALGAVTALGSLLAGVGLLVGRVSGPAAGRDGR
ncbi:MAG: M23 family metallopeptidase [Mycobacteriales bacterium]